MKENVVCPRFARFAVQQQLETISESKEENRNETNRQFTQNQMEYHHA